MMSEWSGVLYGFYSNKPIRKVFSFLQHEVLLKKKYESEHNLYNGEETLLFYKNKEMLDWHMEHGYNEQMNGEGCFCVEAKTVNLFGIASLFEFDGDANFEPYDINLVFENIYYYVLIVPFPIEESKFSNEIHKIFVDVVKGAIDEVSYQ